MECLAAMFDRVVQLGILGPIGHQNPPFRTSLYADDVVFFINPRACEVQAVREMLFSSPTSPRLYTMDLGSILLRLDCPVKPFPCQYLGMPISDTKLKKGSCNQCVIKSWEG